MRVLLVIYACLNAAVYSMLLPLWEGFDEPFHFGYVQQLANGGGVPELGRTRLSKEVAASIALAPASHVVKQNLPQVLTFDEWFALPVEQRRERVAAIDALRRQARYEDSELVNYEAQHAPLAYALLAGPERLLSAASLRHRVLALRLMAAIAGGLLLSAAVARLCGLFGLGAGWTGAAVFSVMSSQMTWAAIARVGNDWLALPLAVWALVLSIEYAERPSARGVVLAALATAAGLLAKGYCLALVPLLPAVALWRRQTRHAVLGLALVGGIAGPWYVRNVRLYGNISGMQESRAGIGLKQAMAGAGTVDWARVIPSSLRAALWSGNSTLSTFSGATLNLVLLLWSAALLLWAFTRHGTADRVTAAYAGLWVVALVYAAVVAWLYVRGVGPAPWLSQPLVSPLMVVAIAGLARRLRVGRPLAIAIVLLSAYVLAATYLAKLIPLYGGYGGRTSLAGLYSLYTGQWAAVAENLNLLSLAPAPVLLAGIAGVIAVQMAAVYRILRNI